MLKLQRLNRKTHGFHTFSHFGSHTGTISPKTSGTLLLSLPSKANSRHFSSQNISVKPHCPSLPSVCTVYVCVRACVRAYMCVRACVCVHVHLLHNYAWTLVDIYILLLFDNIFHLDVHYVCMLVQCFEPQGRRFTNFHGYYYYVYDSGIYTHTYKHAQVTI